MALAACRRRRRRLSEPPPFELPSFEPPGSGGDGGGLGGLLGGLLGGGDAEAPPAAEADSKLPAINPGQKRVYEAEEKPPIEKFVFNLTWAGIAFLVLVEIFINTPLFQTVKPAVLGFMGDDSGAKAAAPSLAGAWDAVGVRPVFLPPSGGAAPAPAAPVVDSAADAAAASLAAAADAAAKARCAPRSVAPWYGVYSRDDRDRAARRPLRKFVSTRNGHSGRKRCTSTS